MSIQLLNQVLSQEAENLYLQIQTQLSKPIAVHNITELGERSQNSYGSLDFSSPDAYHIYVTIQLHGKPFEVNLLHELRHALQIELGFPTVNNKKVAYFHGIEAPFFEEIGRHLQSVILDLDVWHWLVQNGMDIRFFTKRYIRGASAITHQNYDKLSDPFNLANYVCVMIMPFSHATDLQRNTILKEAKFNLDAINLSDCLSKEIAELGYSTPIQAARCMALLLDTLNLWDTYCIAYDKHIYMSSDEFHNHLG